VARLNLEPWKCSESRYIVRDRWLTLRSDHCETPAGIIVEPYYVLEPPEWVQAVAFDQYNRILLIRQYRHGAGLIGLELPCGTVEAGETPDHAAKRELLEETGYAAQALHSLAAVSPNPALFTNRLHTFVATDIEAIQPQRLDAVEDIELEFRTVPDVLELIAAGQFNQALHIAGIFMTLQYLQVLNLSQRRARIG
jgi:8-oxo-dGTP pyrophosphatase MutT (NUDIX family)